MSELSSSSTTTFLLEAARRDGRSGDAVDIAIVSPVTARWLFVSMSRRLGLFYSTLSSAKQQPSNVYVGVNTKPNVV